MPWRIVKGVSELRLPFPPNISHPLPGLAGAFAEMNMSFKKLTVKKGGKTVGYLQSVGCSKPKRTFTLTIAPEGSGPAATYTGAAGKC